MEIEDPFGHDDNDLPLDDLCDKIEKNLADLIRDDSPTAALVPRPLRD